MTRLNVGPVNEYCDEIAFEVGSICLLSGFKGGAMPTPLVVDNIL